MRRFVSLAISILVLAILTPSHAVVSKSISFQAEVWADNWFALRRRLSV